MSVSHVSYIKVLQKYQYNIRYTHNMFMIQYVLSCFYYISTIRGTRWRDSLFPLTKHITKIKYNKLKSIVRGKRKHQQIETFYRAKFKSIIFIVCYYPAYVNTMVFQFTVVLDKRRSEQYILSRTSYFKP